MRAVPATANLFSRNVDRASFQPARGPWIWPPSGVGSGALSSSTTSPSTVIRPPSVDADPGVGNAEGDVGHKVAGDGGHPTQEGQGYYRGEVLVAQFVDEQ